MYHEGSSNPPPPPTPPPPLPPSFPSFQRRSQYQRDDFTLLSEQVEQNEHAQESKLHHCEQLSQCEYECLRSLWKKKFLFGGIFLFFHSSYLINLKFDYFTHLVLEKVYRNLAWKKVWMQREMEIYTHTYITISITL